MPRLKNFREVIQIGIDSQGNEIVMPKDVDWAFFTRMDIRKVRSYHLEPDVLEKVKNAKKRKSTRKLPAVSTKDDKSEGSKSRTKTTSTKAATHKPQDKPNPKKVYKCTECKHTFDFPAGTNKNICPKCLSPKIEKVD